MKTKSVRIKLKLNKQVNDWKKEWQGMPEYDNAHIRVEKITVIFRFSNEKDFEVFHKIIKKHVYGGERIFDGMQRKDKKSAWYPPNEKDSKYYYE